MNGEAFRFLKHQELNSHLTYEGKYAYSDVSVLRIPYLLHD